MLCATTVYFKLHNTVSGILIQRLTVRETAATTGDQDDSLDWMCVCVVGLGDSTTAAFEEDL